ncbi:hypothetical protein BDV38DRAFT_282973 [Aspergillus pseudotamarii]|uniref:Glutathionylspermidine synthase pre-ATP-grasp-like domain-containing protein n=1 Tax=Aspergillus pseudotamarii TaxID=132259 RepID=A0A5N6SU50_ASPPS|nr:uncharacterized protein BDV38DRAFT_282973 [Aspergillus pseudotamarii]KAE8137427.1 hypothetical protein BDV38DRAFT_282973 [Aspergillus pseudotamarii]
MGSSSTYLELQQICLSATQDINRPVVINDATIEGRQRDRASFSQVTNSITQINVCTRLTNTSPHPILVGEGFMAKVKRLNDALSKAVIHIVDNWWEDDASGYRSRMPLDSHQEAVLKWVHQQSRNGSMRPFKDSMGHFRPDLVLTDGDDSLTVPFRVCEINCRNPFNAILSSVYRYETVSRLLKPPVAVQPAADWEGMVEDLFTLFDPSLPIHLVAGRDEMSREDFTSLAHRRTGLCPRIIKLSDLRLEPDASSQTDYALYCSYQDAGDQETKLERIHQAVPLLFADEFCQLSYHLLCHLAFVAVNDFRSILLLDDKRLLGIVRQEAEALSDIGILTPQQAILLKEAIVPTILPRSQELEHIVHSYREGKISKGDFIFKPWSLSRGNGHLLGETLSAQEWEQHLLNMQGLDLSTTDNTLYLLQPYIKQPTFRLYLEDDTKHTDTYMVGTYHAVNGRFVGLGTWRTGPGRICTGFSSGNVPLISVIAADIGR